MNIQFTNLSYVVAEGKKNFKKIVNDVSGEFRAGQLSAIIGPSGCGKTTLLNLLAGYRIQPTAGHISINGRPQNMATLRKISRYVLQKDHLYTHFTIEETLSYAARFKLGCHKTREQYQLAIDEVLNIFHLKEQGKTSIAKISGGEMKRLCIALELINKPPVLILDEPTTGLDEFSATQCIRILKQLALLGHTIICTIHASSTRLSKMFDKIFVLATGQCIYQGAVQHIVPYLEKLNLPCPITYNPTDFIIETEFCDSGHIHDIMVEEIKNGQIFTWLPETKAEQNIDLNNYDPMVFYAHDKDLEVKLYKDKNSWCYEYQWLCLRFLHQIWRNKLNLKLKIAVHILMALIEGCIFEGIGSNAKFALYNLNFTLVVLVHFAFLFMTPLFAYVPQEMKYLRREHFNQWYRLSSYFMALLTSQLPILFATTLIASTTMYILSDQPMELFRYLLFVNMTLIIGWMFMVYGILIGSAFGIVNGLFVGMGLVAVFINIAYYPTDRRELSPFEMFLVKGCCLRYAFEGIFAVLLTFNRADFICPSSEIFCVMSKPKFILKMTASENISYTRSMLILIGFSLLFGGLAFVAFKCRLSSSQFMAKKRQYFREVRAKFQ